MTDETDNSDVEVESTESRPAEGPRAGERLAEARREQQITVLEIAKELHLDEPKVRALEQNSFDVLGAPVFAKGHLRKYATLVDVDIDDILQDYYQLTRSAGIPPVVGKVRKPVREFSPGPWIAVAAALLILGIAYWWISSGRGIQIGGAESANESVGMAALTEQVEDPMAALGGPDASNSNAETGNLESEIEAVAVSMPDTSVTEAPANIESDSPDAVESAVPDSSAIDGSVTAPAAAALVDGQVRVDLSFSGECWTEITDSNGRRLFFDLGRTGRSASVSGDAPLSVLLGNADNVSVRVNGSDYQISAADRRGETARLTIYGT